VAVRGVVRGVARSSSTHTHTRHACKKMGGEEVAVGGVVLLEREVPSIRDDDSCRIFSHHTHNHTIHIIVSISTLTNNTYMMLDDRLRAARDE